MTEEKNYKKRIERLYFDKTTTATPLSRELVVQAGIVVEQLFPPASGDEAFRILTALNLLNAAVKQPWGMSMVSYGYIKGHVTYMFIVQTRLRLPELEAYWDQEEHITYFRIYGVQISFHYMPRYPELMQALPFAENIPQEWDGIKLQQVAADLFLMANPELAAYTPQEQRYLERLMMEFERPDKKALLPSPPVPNPQSQHAVKTALTFNVWHSDCFELFRRKDRRPLRVMRYNGKNYQVLMEYLAAGNALIPWRNPRGLVKGRLYYLSSKMHIRCLSVSMYMRIIAQNCYLKIDGKYCNLCVSYSMARYLSMQFPLLQFINTLNFNRFKGERKYYSCKDIATEPADSEARQLKVWIPADHHGLLRHFNPATLPTWLINDNEHTKEFYSEFEISQHKGRFGIIAYRTLRLLPPIYKHISIQNYHAQVTREDGKLAIYSLHEESFKTDFVYDKIWFDPTHFAILGKSEGCVQMVYDFFPERYNHRHALRQALLRNRGLKSLLQNRSYPEYDDGTHDGSTELPDDAAPGNVEQVEHPAADEATDDTQE